MATVTDRRVRRSAAKTEFQPVSKPRRRWRLLLTIGLGCILMAVALLPSLVSHSPLADWLIAQATMDLNGEASVGSVHLGWFSGPVLADVEIRDAQQRSLVQIQSVRAERSLLGLLWDSSELGRIHIDRPVLAVAYDGSSTNLEEVFASWFEDGESSSDISLELAVSEGTVRLTDVRTDKTWQVEQLELATTADTNERTPINLRASGRVADGQDAGRFAVELALNRTADRSDPLSAIEALEAEVENAPLEMFAPLLARSKTGLQLGGRLNAFAKCEVTGGNVQPEMSIQLTTVVDRFLLGGNALNGDQLALQRIEAGGRAAWRGSLVDIERLRIQTEVGNAVVSGRFNLADESVTNLLKSLAEQTYRIEAGVNLAALAAQLPNTLGLQEGLQIESGDATVVLESRQTGDTMRWDGRADVSRLSATRQGRQIHWPEPIHASLSASSNPQGFSLESLQCQAKYLRLDASGSPQRADGTLDFDLAGLADDASQLIDLGGLRLAGAGHGRFQWLRQPDQQFAVSGNLQIDQFELGLKGESSWADAKLRLNAEALGSIASSQTILQSAKLQLDVDEDRLTASLAEPLQDVTHASSYPVNLETEGELARWSARIAPLLPLEDWQMIGRIKASGRLDYASEATTLRNGKIHVEELTVRSPQVNFYDPEVDVLVGAARWVPSQSRIEIPSATLSGQTVGAGVEPLVVAWSAGELRELNGTVALKTSLDRVQQWTTATVTKPPVWMVRGALTARSTFRAEEGKAAFDADLSVEKFAARHQSGKEVSEAKVHLTARGQYDPAAQHVVLEKAKLESGLVGFDAGGTFDLAADTPRIDLDGQYTYDLVRLSELGRTHLGIPLFAAGRNASPFACHGPMSLAEVEATLGLNWTGAEIGGFQIGPGSLDAQMAGGALRTAPIQLDVSEGKMALTPHVTFSEQGSLLQVEAGRVADRIRISPRMCAGALQYIAPPLAGVATAEGTFSIDLEQCRIPLDDPAKGDLSGRMTVHAVSIAPGPLIRELATTLGFGKTAQLSRESTVPFRMVDGRVYHRDLELVFPEVTMRTFGSVGLDQSLALIVEMPIPDKWRTGHATLDRVVQNQTLRLPIGGSLQEPAIDRRELERQAGQFMQNAARNVLESQLNRQLERLLQPK